MMTDTDLDKLEYAADSYNEAPVFADRERNPEWLALCTVVQSIIDRHVREALGEGVSATVPLDRIGIGLEILGRNEKEGEK